MILPPLRLALTILLLLLLEGMAHAQDTSRVHTWIRQANELVNVDPGQALKFADSAVIRSRKISHVTGEAEALHTIGTSLFWLGKIPEARDSLRAAQQLFQTMDSTHGVVRCLRNIGLTYWRTGDYVEALDSYDLGLRFLDTRDDPLLRAGLLNNIGLIYELQGDYPAALECFLRTLASSREANHKNYIAIALMNIGRIYQLMGDYDRALEYHHQALEHNQTNREKRFLRHNYSNLGSVYREKKELGKALEYFRKAFDHARDAHEPDGMINALNSIGDIYIEQGNLREAETSLHEGLRLARKTGVQEEEILSLQHLARIEQTKSSWQQARHYYEQALATARKIGNKKAIAECGTGLSDVLVRLGNHREALAIYRMAVAMRDSLINEDNLKEIARLEFRQTVAAKERENELLKKTMALQQAELDRDAMVQRAYVVGLTLMMVSVLVLVVAFVMKRRDNSKLDDMNRVVSRQNEELKSLNEKKNEFLGVVAHDLRNPIGAIANAMEILRMDVGDASSAPSNSDVIDDTLTVTKRLTTMVNSLLDVTAIEAGKIILDVRPMDLERLAATVVKFQKLRAEKKGIRLDLRPPSQCPVVLADPQRISEVFENLISNAIAYTDQGGEIHVSFESSIGKWITHIEDTGQGFLPDEIPYAFAGTHKMTARPTAGEMSIGFGLLAVKKIIDLHQGEIWLQSERNRGSRFSFALRNA